MRASDDVVGVLDAGLVLCEEALVEVGRDVLDGPKGQGNA